MKNVLIGLAAAAVWSLLSFEPLVGNAELQKNVGRGTFGRLCDIAANDGTKPGGVRTGRTLRISLVARWGLWYPDGPGTIGLPVEAFGEVGRPLQIPGPLDRKSVV